VANLGGTPDLPMPVLIALKTANRVTLYIALGSSSLGRSALKLHLLSEKKLPSSALTCTNARDLYYQWSWAKIIICLDVNLTSSSPGRCTGVGPVTLGSNAFSTLTFNVQWQPRQKAMDCSLFISMGLRTTHLVKEVRDHDWNHNSGKIFVVLVGLISWWLKRVCHFSASAYPPLRKFHLGILHGHFPEICKRLEVLPDHTFLHICRRTANSRVTPPSDVLETIMTGWVSGSLNQLTGSRSFVATLFSKLSKRPSR
jgi:hypothetical protein